MDGSLQVWLYQVPPHGMTAVSLAHAILQAFGRRTGEGEWTSVRTAPRDAGGPLPTPRTCFASAPAGHVDGSAIVIWGGIGQDGDILADGWILSLD
ncbi:hypothetical protein CDD80_920 [Ophiocordyceps camponoti-rufipedis]|uniref:Uncharacterized protein n=1 Tax=Ophiocordyceps camponoti-rufipedis TaxID=2004952 RepID=A0A2C5YDB2_9HYPO|nr:hypothetical protein CDD80_920 [Ophiocordyceps camponoti-rufipedis]